MKKQETRRVPRYAFPRTSGLVKREPSWALRFFVRQRSTPVNVLDVSPYGAQILSPTPIEANQEVEMTMHIPMLKEPVPVKGVVRYVSRIDVAGQKPRWNAGLKFFEYGANGKERLKKLCESEVAWMYEKKRTTVTA